MGGDGFTCVFAVLFMAALAVIPPLLLEFVIENWLAMIGNPVDVSFWLVWGTWLVVYWLFSAAKGAMSS